MRRSLFEIDRDLEKIAYDIAEAGGDITGFEEQLDEYLSGLFGEANEKAEAYLVVIKELKARAEARKREARALSELGRVDESAAERLTKRIHDFMLKHDIGRFDGKRGSISVCQNGGAQPIEIDEGVDIESVPEDYLKINVDIDRAAVREALERGEAVPFARFTKRGTHVRIK